MRNTQIRGVFFPLGGFISQEYCFSSQNKFHFLKSQKHYICLLKFFKLYILTIGKLLAINRDWERFCENPYRNFTHRGKKNFCIYSAALSFSLGVRLTLRSRKWATREGKCTTQNSLFHQRFFSPRAGVRGWGVWRCLSAGLRYAHSIHCVALSCGHVHLSSGREVYCCPKCEFLCCDCISRPTSGHQSLLSLAQPISLWVPYQYLFFTSHTTSTMWRRWNSLWAAVGQFPKSLNLPHIHCCVVPPW